MNENVGPLLTLVHILRHIDGCEEDIIPILQQLKSIDTERDGFYVDFGNLWPRLYVYLL
jgi:hypothetical protein